MFELLETNNIWIPSFGLLTSSRLAPISKDFEKTFNIQPANTTKPKSSRGLTAPRIAALIEWASKEGPLAGTNI